MGRSSLRGATQLERQCLSAFFSVTLKCACSRRRLRGVPSALQCAAFSRGSTLFDCIWPDFFPSLPVFSYYKRKKPRCQQNSEFRMKNSELGLLVMKGCIFHTVSRCCVGRPWEASPSAPAGPARSLTLHPFSGSNKLYLSYSFPVKRGEPCGALPYTSAGSLTLHPFPEIAICFTQTVSR